MNWVSLLLQLVSFRKSIIESRVMIENAKAAAERGKRAALFGTSCLLAAVFFLAGVITAILELGLQVDRGEFFRFSGLLGSATAFLVLAALVVLAASMAFRGPRAVEEEEIPPPPMMSPEAELKRLGAQLILRFLSKLKEKNPNGPTGPGGGASR